MRGRRAQLLTRTGPRIAADPSRVIARMFVPGREGFDDEDSRADAVITRLLALSDYDVQSALTDVVGRCGPRHRDLIGVFRGHASALADRVDEGQRLDAERTLLLGATFTSEIAIEGAALCNPSVVPHPEGAEPKAESLRFLLSVRGVGEGHRSSIGFMAGWLHDDGRVEVEPRSEFATTTTTRPGPLHGAVLRAELDNVGMGGENAEFVLGGLPEIFTVEQLRERLRVLRSRSTTRVRVGRTVSAIWDIAERSYACDVPSGLPLSEAVLWPATRTESHGMEDARFVAFTEDDGSRTTYATYTAYDGSAISQQLLQTEDFRSFTSSPISGPAAGNKGLALFPRRVGGRFAALSRRDRESNSIAFSDDVRVWPTPARFQVPLASWELLQLGNCGSPIETNDGWLVLTHGVGPMRTYSIGAVLLDLDDPTQLIGRLEEPLLTPLPEEQNGYVPNVLYSCGSLVHEGTLLVPYGIGDAAIGFATGPVSDVLSAMQRPANG